MCMREGKDEREEENKKREQRRGECVWKSKVNFQELMFLSTVESGSKTHRQGCKASTFHPLCHLTNLQYTVSFVCLSL